MTRKNARGGDDNGDGRAGRNRNGESAPSYGQQPDQRTGSRHWMHDSEPPRMDYGKSHAGYGDYGTREYDPRPENARQENESATRPRDFRDYGRGDYRGNVGGNLGPGGFGYAESNYGPTRYGEAFGRSGRDPGADSSRDLDRREQQRSFAGRGPRNYQRSDERIREMICERLTDDPHVDASDVTIEVKDGVVTLAGSVTDRRMKHRIEDVAADVARGNEIRNEVRVQG